MSLKTSGSNHCGGEGAQQQWTKLSTSIDSGSNVKFAGEEAKDRLYEPKHKKKLVRVLTVVAYIFFVSLAAIMLSLYYVFLWSGNQKESVRVVQRAPNVVTQKCAYFLDEFKESAPIAAFQEETTVPPPLPLLNSSENVTDIYDDIGVETVYINRENSVLLKKLIKHKPYIN